MTKDSSPYKFPFRLGEDVQRNYQRWRRERHPRAAELTVDEQEYVYRWLDYDPDLWQSDPAVGPGSVRARADQMQLIKEGLLEVMDEWVAAEGDEKRLLALKRHKFGHRGT